MKKYYIGLLILIGMPLTMLAQQPEFPLKPLPFTEWKTSGGWQTAGSISVNPFTNDLQLTSGDKIYVGNGKGGQLETKSNFQDCQLSFDFVLSPESESVFYVWGKQGIVLSSEKNKLGELKTKDGQTFAPLTYAGRAPGLWQHMEVAVRRAENVPNKALIEYVKINGLKVLQNVFVDASELSGPMVFNNASGVMAIRDFKLLSFADVKPITVKNIDFKHYKEFDWENQRVAEGNTPALTGSMNSLHHDIGQGRVRENFLNQYSITLDVAQKGNYAFLFDYAGNGSLAIDGKPMLEKQGQTNRESRVAYVSLEKGTHQLQVEYSKAWWGAQMGLFIAGDGIRPYPIHALTSLPEKRLPGEIIVNPTRETEVIRSFFMHGDEKRTHVVSVGSPQGFHYAFDLDQGALLAAWKGEFANVTEMWYQRGEPQILQPKGLTITLSGNPMIALKSQKNSLPDSYEDVSEIDYQTTKFDENEQPSFVYKFNNRTLTQTLIPTNDGLKHEVTIDGNVNDLILRIAEGKNIEKLDNGTFRVDDYYVQLSTAAGAEVINNKNMKAIIVPAKSTVNYSIIW
jgi:hypothetical protein